MTSEDKFKQSVIGTLAKRAANRCSNPDCRAITSGPTDAPMGAINVGEAAHIFGANPGSARYEAGMTSADRSSITNAIWLCGNCHKIVDDDAVRYPSGLLFEWQREHERWIGEQVGKAGAELRHRYEARHLEEFGRLSYLAERLIIEKGELWEYRLTAEVLRFEMSSVLRRWHALKRGLYARPLERTSKREFFWFIQTKLREIQDITSAFDELMNIEFEKAWGLPGEPGDDVSIVETSRLFAEMCQTALAWEEAVRFQFAHEEFSSLHSLFIGVGGLMIDEAAKVPEFLSRSLAGSPSGKHELNLTLALPDGWNEAVLVALQESADAMADIPWAD